MSSFTPQKVIIIINSLSGGVESHALQEVSEAVVARNLQIVAAYDIAKAATGEWQPMLSKADAVVSFAGDGTLRSILNASSVPVLPLPGGTMNMLPEAALGSGPWRQHLQLALQNPQIKTLEAAQIGDHRFYVAALLGTSAHFGKAREAARHGLVLGAATKFKRAFSLLNRKKMSYRPTTQAQGYLAARELMLMLAAARHTGEPVEGMEVAAFGRMSATKLINLGGASVLSTWRDSDAVRVSSARELHVMANGTVPALLDGEFVRLPRTFHVKYLPEAAQIWSYSC